MVFWKADNENFDSTNILLFLYKWRKPLVVVTVLAIIASVIFSSPIFITPKFKSTVILYPAATNAISKALLTESGGVKEDILDFGEDEETEQLLQILHSNRIRDRIIERYNLMEHYGIDTSSHYKLTRLYREYEDNITFKRTEFMAVKITVLDKDPQMAADIANDIADLLDSTKNEMQKKRAQRAYEIVKEQYFKLRHEVQVMEDSLSKLRELGVHDYESQAEMINQQLAIELANGNQSAVKRLEDKLEILARYGGPYVSLRDALEHEKKQLSMLRAKYEEAKTDAEEVLPTKFVVNSAYKAERKSYPIRWLIVVVTTVSAFLLTLVLILMFENLSDYLPERFRAMAPEGNAIKKRNSPPDGKDPPVPPREPPRPYSSADITQKPVNNPPKKIVSEAKQTEETENPKKEIKEVKKTQNDTQEKAVKTEKRDNQMERYFTNTNILKLLFKWKLHLGVVLFVAIVLAVIFSSPWFITPKYKSFAIVYPTNIENYSEESESEQMLQWFQSREIMDRVINAFDLGKRYDIDKSFKYYQSTIESLYHENVIISKTPYEAISIEAYDRDPLVACNMVDSIIVFFNEMVLDKHSEKYREALQVMEARLMIKEAEMDSVAGKLYELRTKYGIIDYPNQSREVARGYLGTVDGDNASRINKQAVLRLKENIEELGGEWTRYNDRYFDLIDEYGAYKIDYEWALVNANKKITYTTLVTKPVPADKKAYPVRWVIVVLTAIGTLFFSFLAVLIIENYESIKRNF